jgi:hypothetical protein
MDAMDYVLLTLTEDFHKVIPGHRFDVEPEATKRLVGSIHQEPLWWVSDPYWCNTQLLDGDCLHKLIEVWVRHINVDSGEAISPNSDVRTLSHPASDVGFGVFDVLPPIAYPSAAGQHTAWYLAETCGSNM